MYIKKKVKEELYQRFNGRCGYTGKPLNEHWQIDHILPKSRRIWNQPLEVRQRLGITYEVNDIQNLIPTIDIINHYKRGLTLEEFRHRILTLHLRLAKLPKKTNVLHIQKRKDYLLLVAELFNITPVNPWGGKFYFEQ